MMRADEFQPRTRIIIYLCQLFVCMTACFGTFAGVVASLFLLGSETVVGRTVSSLGSEGLFPLETFVTAAFGFGINKRFRDCFAPFIWVIPAIYLAFEIHSYWPYAADPTWHGIWDNFFGKNCGGDTECNYELLVTMPFYSSISYSLGSLVGLCMDRAKHVNREK